MLAHTHSMISYVVVENIKMNKGVYLNERKFSWGSVKPDLVLPPFRPKHYMKESLDDIVEQIVDLATQQNVEINMKGFCEKIGAITHFLTDFFTLPHSQRWEWMKSGRTIEHIAYEQKLKKIAHDRPSLIQAIPLEIPLHYTKEDLKKWILFQHTEYQQRTDFKHDLEFACSVSQAVTIWILNQVMKKTSMQVVV